MLPRKLLEISDLAAGFVRSLASSKRHSYSELATDIGLTRNVLYYFAAEADSGISQSANIKLSAFSKILKWLETTHLENLCQSENQKLLARKIKTLLETPDISTEPQTDKYAPLLDGFELSAIEVEGVLSRLPNLLIGIRQRGTTERFQISIHSFQRAAEGNAVTWDMTFLQGRNPYNGSDIPRHDQVGVNISGFAFPMENTITCVGRLQKQSDTDHNLSMMNIILKKPTKLENSHNLYQGSYYGYSRHEAISRHMIFISTDHSTDFSPMVLSGCMGDVGTPELKAIYPAAYQLFKEGVLGFSVGMAGKKVNSLSLGSLTQKMGLISQ